MTYWQLDIQSQILPLMAPAGAPGLLKTGITKGAGKPSAPVAPGAPESGTHLAVPSVFNPCITLPAGQVPTLVAT